MDPYCGESTCDSAYCSRCGLSSSPSSSTKCCSFDILYCDGTLEKTGATGPTGATGLTGPTGPISLIAGSAANTSGATLLITLLNPTVNIPFPNAQNLSAGITVNNPTADTFTINTTGRYYIVYSVYPALTLLTSFQLFRNAVAVAGTQVNAAIGVGMVYNQIIINITAGDTVRVRASATLAATVSLAAGTTAATLAIVQVS